MEFNKSERRVVGATKDDIYEVQEIVGMKSEGDITVFRVRWKGYGPQSDTWEPESNLRTVWKMVEKYKRKITKINKMPLVCNTRRRGRPSNSSSTGSTGTGNTTSISSIGSITAKNSSTVDIKKGDHLVVNNMRRQKTTTNGNNININPINDNKVIINNNNEKNRHKLNKSHKKKFKNGFQTPNQKSKDTFWKDLEEGKIDVFKEDLYSRVKSRASSRGNSMENSPKQNSSSPKEFDKCWPNSVDSIDSITNTVSNDSEDQYMDGQLRIKFCKTEALMAALKDSDQELAAILITNGSDINSTFGNRNGSTPLMICCEENNVVMAQFLLSNGALKDVQNQNGDTALTIACRLGFKDIIKLLLTYGSNFAIINKIGRNALRIARMSDEKAIQSLLIEHISKLTISLEAQVMNMLCNIAKIVNALFPIQCYSLSEAKQFRLLFEFDLDKHPDRRPGVGYILFAANTSITDSGINCEFSGPNIVEEVLLNGTAQKPLTEGAQFVFSFMPLSRGTNELVLKTVPEGQNRDIKLLVCAYEIQLLINDSHQCCDDRQQN